MVPQAVLFLPKEEGGQGLVHIKSRVATFRVQFLQKYLTTACKYLWKDVASTILRRVNGIGIDAALFFMDVNLFNLSELSPFYKGVLKAWNLFKWKMFEPAVSLYWLLEEPLVGGARMDIQDSSTPSLTHTLCTTGVVTLKKIVDAAGPSLMDACAVADLLGLRSVRYIKYILKRWSEKLSEDEFELLRIYSVGAELYPDLNGCSGLLLDVKHVKSVDLYTVNGKVLYKCCVKALNKSKLNGKEDSVWRKNLEVTCADKPGWRDLYKLPSKKQTGDLQWKILHGAVAVNAFISVMNPTVSNECPFCGRLETIFHCFLQCGRIEALFSTLKTLFLSFKEKWSKVVFLFGAGYRKINAAKWQLLNFLLGEAKMSIYLARRNKIKREVFQDLVSVFVSLVRARDWIDFKFHKEMKSLDSFVQQWCDNDVICSVDNEELTFGAVFK